MNVVWKSDFKTESEKKQKVKRSPDVSGVFCDVLFLKQDNVLKKLVSKDQISTDMLELVSHALFHTLKGATYEGLTHSKWMKVSAHCHCCQIQYLVNKYDMLRGNSV